MLGRLAALHTEALVKTAGSSRTKVKLFIDFLIFAGFVVAWDQHSTGIAGGEWLTIGSSTALVVHLLLSCTRIVELGVRFCGRCRARAKLAA